MFARILVANDGSRGARRALELAVQLAARFGAELHTISVEEGLPHYAATTDEVDAVKEQENHYFDQVAREAREFASASGVTLDAHVAPGHEVETIIEFCRQGGFDLLVVGFMGHSRIYERIWGSTSQTLTRLAPCSVLVAK
ncbi:MAG: universal stress protein [Armatimonadota bacterium]